MLYNVTCVGLLLNHGRFLRGPPSADPGMCQDARITLRRIVLRHVIDRAHVRAGGVTTPPSSCSLWLPHLPFANHNLAKDRKRFFSRRLPLSMPCSILLRLPPSLGIWLPYDKPPLLSYKLVQWMSEDPSLRVYQSVFTTLEWTTSEKNKRNFFTCFKFSYHCGLVASFRMCLSLTDLV